MQTSSANVLGTAIAALYSAGPDASYWPAALNAVRRAVGAQSGFWRVVDTARSAVTSIYTIGYDEAFVRAYQQHFIELDPYRRSFRLARHGQLLITDQLVPDRDAHRRTEYFNDYERPQDKYHAAGGTIAQYGTSTVEFGVQRGRRAGSFSLLQLRQLRFLMGHASRATAMRGFRDEAGCLAASALDHAKEGIALFNAELRLVYVNRAFETAIQQHKGLMSQCRVALSDPAGTEMIHNMVRLASIGVPSGPVTAACAPSLRWNAVPLMAPSLDADAAKPSGVMLRLSESPVVDDAYEAIAAQYRMTPSEVKVAVGLSRGIRLKDLARQSGRAESTLRSQLHSIFAKTNTNNQAQLVAAISPLLSSGGL